MFKRKSKAELAKDVATERARQAGDVAVDLRDRAASNVQSSALSVQEAVSALGHSLKDKYVPRAEAAASTAATKAAHVRDRAIASLDHGVDVAAPKAERAVASVGPRVDHARDVIVDDVLPKLQELLAGVQSAKDDILSKQDGPVAVVTGAPKKKKRRGRTLIALGLLAAVGSGVAYVLNRSQQPTSDPWATPSSQPARAQSGTGSPADSLTAKAKDAGDKLKSAAGNATDKLKDATGDAGQNVDKAAEDAKHAASKAGGAAADKAENAGDKLTDAAGDAGDAAAKAVDAAGDTAEDAADQAKKNTD